MPMSAPRAGWANANPHHDDDWRWKDFILPQQLFFFPHLFLCSHPLPCPPSLSHCVAHIPHTQFSTRHVTVPKLYFRTVLYWKHYLYTLLRVLYEVKRIYSVLKWNVWNKRKCNWIAWSPFQPASFLFLIRQLTTLEFYIIRKDKGWPNTDAHLQESSDSPCWQKQPSTPLLRVRMWCRCERRGSIMIERGSEGNTHYHQLKWFECVSMTTNTYHTHAPDKQTIIAALRDKRYLFNHQLAIKMGTAVK